MSVSALTAPHCSPHYWPDPADPRDWDPEPAPLRAAYKAHQQPWSKLMVGKHAPPLDGHERRTWARVAHQSQRLGVPDCLGQTDKVHAGAREWNGVGKRRLEVTVSELLGQLGRSDALVYGALLGRRNERGMTHMTRLGLGRTLDLTEGQVKGAVRKLTTLGLLVDAGWARELVPNSMRHGKGASFTYEKVYWRRVHGYVQRQVDLFGQVRYVVHLPRFTPVCRAILAQRLAKAARRVRVPPPVKHELAGVTGSFATEQYGSFSEGHSLIHSPAASGGLPPPLAPGEPGAERAREAQNAFTGSPRGGQRMPALAETTPKGVSLPAENSSVIEVGYQGSGVPLLQPAKVRPWGRLGFDSVPASTEVGVPGCSYPYAIPSLIPAPPLAVPDPGTAEVQLVTTPWQQPLSPGFDELAEAARFMRLYAGASWVMYNARRKAPADVGSARYRKVLIDCLHMLCEEKLAPAAWLGYFFEAWKLKLGPPSLRSKPPPINVLTSLGMIAKHATFAHDNSRFHGGVSITSPEYTELMHDYGKMQFTLFQVMAITPREQLSVMERYFPNRTYDARLRQVQKIAEYQKAALDKANAAGEWVL